MKFKIASVLLVVVMIIAIIELSQSAQATTTIQSYCFQENGKRDCVQCYTDMSNQTLSSRTVLNTPFSPTMIGYVNNCVKYECTDILQLINLNSSTFQFENDNETNQYIKILGLEVKQQYKNSILIQTNKSVITFSKGKSKSNLHFIFQKGTKINIILTFVLLIYVFLLQILFVRLICNMTQNRFFSSQVVIFKVILTIIIGINAVIQYQQNILTQWILRQIISVLLYIALIFVIQTRLVIKCFEIVGIIDAYLLKSMHLIDENTQLISVLLIAFVILFISVKNTEQRLFTNLSRRISQILLISYPTIQIINYLYGSVFIEFVSVYLTIIALVFLEPVFIKTVEFQQSNTNPVVLVEEVTDVDVQMPNTSQLVSQIHQNDQFNPQTSHSVVQQTDRMDN